MQAIVLAKDTLAEGDLALVEQKDAWMLRSLDL